MTAFEFQQIGDQDLAWLRFERNSDQRGWLSKIFNQRAASDFGLPVFSQDNISQTGVRGQERGLHFQRSPHDQHKLFRVGRGRVFNVVVDLRPERFGAGHACEIDVDLRAWIYIPAGNAHGFQALEDRVGVHFKLSSHFASSSQGGVKCDDPALAIEWPPAFPQELLSVRDRNAHALEDARTALVSDA